MYLARFSYDVRPVDRQRAIEFIRREVKASRALRLTALAWAGCRITHRFGRPR